VPDSAGLRLNISETDNARDLELARSVAPYFRVKKPAAEEIITRFRRTVAQWRVIAKRIGISAKEQDWMADAFALAR